MQRTITKCLLMLACMDITVAQAQRNAILSTQNIGGNKVDVIDPHVTQTADGGAIFHTTSNSTVGNIRTACNADTTKWINSFRKYDMNGQLAWERCYNNDSGFQANFIYPLTDGGFIHGLYGSPIAGKTFGARREDAAGNILWTKFYGGGSSYLTAMTPTTDGGFIMGGEINNAGGDFPLHHGGGFTDDIWLLKIDSNGNKLWSRTVGGSSDDFVTTLVSTNDGGCYLAGSTGSDDYDCTGLHSSPNFTGDMYVARISDTGGIIWHRCIGGSDIEGASDACADGNGGLLTMGTTTSIDGDIQHAIAPQGTRSHWATHIDSAGNIVWEYCYGSPTGLVSITPSSVIARSTDGTIWFNSAVYYKGGQIDTVYGGGDAWVVSLDSAGHFKTGTVLGSASGDEGKAIAALGDGTILVGGMYYIPVGTPIGVPASHYPASLDYDVFLTRLSHWPESVTELTGKSTSTLKIYPNPAGSELHITTDGPAGSLAITDINGRQVYNATIPAKARLTITTGSWSSGQYIVSYYPKDGSVQSQKITVNN